MRDVTIRRVQAPGGPQLRVAGVVDGEAAELLALMVNQRPCAVDFTQALRLSAAGALTLAQRLRTRLLRVRGLPPRELALLRAAGLQVAASEGPGEEGQP